MSIPDIIDNSEYQVFDVLNELLETRKSADLPMDCIDSLAMI